MMRHAHSEERLQNIRDHDRPITEAGRASAREVGTVHHHDTSHLCHRGTPKISSAWFDKQ